MSAPQPRPLLGPTAQDLRPATLPGRFTALSFAPYPSWGAVTQRDARCIHGVLSRLLAEPHQVQVPQWSLWRQDGRWWVHWYGASGVALCDGAYAVPLFGRDRELLIGPPCALRMPPLAAPRYRVTIASVSPVSTSREGNREAVLTHCSQGLWSMARGVGQRLGLDLTLPHESVCLLSQATQAVETYVGGKISRGSKRPGWVVGWEGRLELECSGHAAWLFEATSHLGLGALTSMGFGRVQVRCTPC